MRADIIMLVCGAIALALYLRGGIIPAAIMVVIGVGVLVWAVLTRR